MSGEDFNKALDSNLAESLEHELRTTIFNLRQQLSRKDGESNAYKASLLEAKAEAEEALTELSLYKKIYRDRPRWLRGDRRKKSDHQRSLVAFLSDTHYGEVVRPEELGGFNAYNMKIAEIRTREFFERTVHVAQMLQNGPKFDGIVLALGGDLVSGDIHEELVETNELSTYRTIETVLPWLAKGVEVFAEEFGKVHVVSAPGNHGRNSAKPRHKKRSENNADTHLANLLAKTVRDDKANITFDVPEGMDVDFDLYGSSFTLEHGDNMRFSGTSEIGAFGPVKRGNLRKTRKRQEQGRPFQYGLYGHFHQFIPAYTQGLIMNGSLKGYDEYASGWQFQPEKAQQALVVVTPEHGISMVAPVFCQNRDREGW